MSSHIKNRKPMFPVRTCRKPVFPALHLLARRRQRDAWWMPNRRRRKIRKRMRKSKNQFLRFSVARLIAVTSHLAGGSLLLCHIEGNFVDPISSTAAISWREWSRPTWPPSHRRVGHQGLLHLESSVTASAQLSATFTNSCQLPAGRYQLPIFSRYVPSSKMRTSRFVVER